ncbi:MAG: hypothetical protein H6719_23555 [Sandaracinaceae bacterium]|nr:hypothetical protein [Sandaracinaceae bacterium]
MTRRGTILGVSVSDVRLAAAAGLTLFALLGGHTVLEVARDALFLATLPARELPFTYLAIALFAWLAVGIDRRLSTRLEQRRLAMITLLVAGAGTVGFYFAFGSDQWWVWWIPHLFYVWTGLISTFAVTQFWRLLAELFTIVEAKRLYSRIAAGGSLGAVAGASLADLTQTWLEPRELLLVGAGLLVLTSFIPGLVFPPVPPVERSDEAARPSSDGGPDAITYVRRLVALVALSSIAAVLVDYVFKATIADELEPSELAAFFSQFYVALNLASLFVQIALAPRILSWLGATRAIAVLPVLFALGAAGHAVTGLFALAVLLKGADGGLRHSLHRSAFELLYLPLSKAVRNRYKTVIDALGQRGGQAFGSLGILALGLAGVGPRQLSIAVVVLSVLWVVLALALRRRYLDLFRANLRAGSIETRVEVPQLDLGSLESLIASLNSPRDDEVLATLDVLVDYERTALVPALLLYHPSRPVVLKTLELFAASKRSDYLPIARRLLEREDPEIQAAAMHAMAGPLDEAELRSELGHDHGRPARAAVLVGLVARGLDADGSAREELRQCTESAEPIVHLALARAIRLRADPRFADLLDAMAKSEDPELVGELAAAYGAMGDPVGIPHLIGWLGPRYSRLQARDALVALGDPAREAMIEALGDVTLPLDVRGHLPRSLSRFRSAKTARALFDQLLDEPDGWVAYKILRALRPLRESMPDLRFDERALTRLIRDNLERAARVLSRRVALARGVAEDPSRATQGSELLEPVLLDKQNQALDRAVRLVALLSPKEDLRRITNALRHGDRRRRAESRELLGAIAPSAVAPALDTLLADDPLEDRLARARASIEAPPVEADYATLMKALLEDESEAVRAVAAYHVGELGLVELRDDLARACELVSGLTRDVVVRALEDLDVARREVARG